MQGNFLSPAVQAIVRESLREAHARRAAAVPQDPPAEAGVEGEEEVVERMSYLDMEKREMMDSEGGEDGGRVADVRLSFSLPPTCLVSRD